MGGPTQSSVPQISYKLIPKERYVEVIQHFRDFFFVDAPLSKATHTCKKGEPNKYFEESILGTMKQNLSLMAVDESDNIAGVLVNGIMHKGDLKKSMNELEKCDDMRYKTASILVLTLLMSVDFFAKYQVDEVFESRLLSVDSNYRRLGIATELIKRSEDLGRQTGAKVLMAAPSGKYSKKLFKEQGCEVLGELFYKDYLDENGKTMFNVEAPHDRIQLVTKLL